MKYVFDNKTFENQYTTLPCYGDLRLDAIYVVALDSVITARVPKRYALDVVKECVEDYVKDCAKDDRRLIIDDVESGGEKYVEIRPDIDQLKGYSEWRELAECYIKCIAEKALSKSQDLLNKLHVIITPANMRVGNFVYKWAGRGVENDFAAFLLASLYKHFKMHFENTKVGDTITIYLDVTHGINYMPALTTHVVELFASILLARKDVNNVRIEILNAIESGIGEYEVLRIKREIVSRIRLNVEELRGVEKHTLNVIKALALAAPLLLYYLCRDKDGHFKEPDEIVRKYLESRNIIRKDGGVIIETDPKARDEGLTNVYGLYAEFLANEVCKAGWSNEIKALSNAEHYFEKVSQLHADIVHKEINNLLNVLKKSGDFDVKSYAELKGLPQGDCKSIKWGEREHIRNFVAHAGLSDVAVVIRRVNESYVLEYKNECLDGIFEELLESENVSRYVR